MRTNSRLAWWFLPLVSGLLAAACLAVFWIGGDPRRGVYSALVLLAVAVLFLAGGRSETIRGLRGDGRDEYWRAIDVTATAFAGLVLVALVIGMCFWEWGHGRDGSPYTQLGAVAGVSYVVAIVVVRRRG